MINVDRCLFVYLTNKSGHTLTEAAAAMGILPSGLTRRLSGEIPFRATEMEAWMKLTGVMDAGPIFFPAIVAEKQQTAAESNG